MEKIEKINIYKLSSKVKLEYGSFKRDTLCTILVEIVAGGLSGWGECGGRRWKRFFDPYKSCLNIGKKIIGRKLKNSSTILRKDETKTLAQDSWSSGYNGAFRSAREAYSIAAYDLFGRMSAKSVSSLLGDKIRSSFPGMPVIHMSSPEAMARTAVIWHKQKGYKFLKIKLGKDSCIERLEAIRNLVGNDVDLHIDFNHSLGKNEDTVRLINSLYERFSISIVEDPFRARDSTYRRLRGEIEPKLMMDSGTFWPNIRTVAHKGAVDIINHHTCQQGGLDLAVLISKVAGAHGIDDAVGSSGLVGVSETAFQQLAGVIGLSRPCESLLFADNYADEAFEDYYGIDGISVVEGGHTHEEGTITLNGKSGLGIDVNTDIVNKHAEQITVVEISGGGKTRITNKK